MGNRVAVIVSVSPFEPEDVVLKSALHLKNLRFDGLETKIVYVVDLNGKEDRRGLKLKEMGVEVYERPNRRGRKAGAINDCIQFLRNSGFEPDYVVFFDVDTRPTENFVIECVKALGKEKDAYISSSERKIINPESFVAETLDIEYRIFNYFLKRSSFKNFNGLIGVIRGELITKNPLDETSFAEDLEFNVRMHAVGYRSVFVERCTVYEQAPIRWKDLYAQRRRWYYGGIQLLKKRYLRENLLFGIRVFSAVILAHLIILLFPLLIFAPPIILYRFRKIKKLRMLAGLAIYLAVNQTAALASLYSFLRRREIEWQGVKRVER